MIGNFLCNVVPEATVLPNSVKKKKNALKLIYSMSGSSKLLT